MEFQKRGGGMLIQFLLPDEIRSLASLAHTSNLLPIGNAINATTGAALTEMIGWSAHKYFENLGEEPPA